MASVRKEVQIKAPPEEVWDALRDVGALHTRLAPGFVVDTRMDGTARIVTFGNGMVVREEIVDVDDATRRVAWAIVGGRFLHYNGAAYYRRNRWFALRLDRRSVAQRDGRWCCRDDRGRTGRHQANYGRSLRLTPRADFQISLLRATGIRLMTADSVSSPSDR